MRASLRSIAIAALCGSALAVKGVISDDITTDSEGCNSLCGANNDCYAVLYDSQCHECWQLDCHPDTQPVEGLEATGKATDRPAPKCDGVKFPTKPTVCKSASSPGASSASSAATNAATSAASTVASSESSAASASPTSASDNKSAGWRTTVPWMAMGGLGVVAGLVAM